MSKKKLHINLANNQLMENKMLKLITKFGILKVHRHILFEKKFGEDGGFEAVIEEDSFGYATQGYLYAEQPKEKIWWVDSYQ